MEELSELWPDNENSLDSVEFKKDDLFIIEKQIIRMYAHNWLKIMNILFDLKCIWVKLHKNNR